MKLLLLDCETAPIVANVWGIWQENVGLNQIQKDWHLLSFACKWYGEKEIIYFDQSKERHIENDKGLIVKLHKLLDEAEIVIAQNGDSFDIPKINARMVYWGILPPSPYRTIDTLKIAKKHFGFTSNKLEYLAKYLKCKTLKDEHREFAGFELWKECIAKNQKAWKEMRKYNIADILALEEIYEKLRPFAEGHHNLNAYIDDDKPRCPKCGGDVICNGHRITNFGKYQKYQCKNCGGWSRGRKSTIKTKNQLVN